MSLISGPHASGFGPGSSPKSVRLQASPVKKRRLNNGRMDGPHLHADEESIPCDWCCIPYPVTFSEYHHSLVPTTCGRSAAAFAGCGLDCCDSDYFLAQQQAVNRASSVWISDLTEQGIEPNPGPTIRTPRKKRAMTSNKSKSRGVPTNRDVPPPHRCTVTTISCPIRVPPKTYIFKQMDTTLTTFQGSAVAGSGFVFFATLSGNIAQATTFTSLFDQYRFLSMSVAVLPRQSITTTASGQPSYFTVVDYDDATTPTSRAFMVDYDNCTQCEVYESVSRTFSPHVALSAYSGAFTSFANRAYQWIDVASPTVQHYGFKFWIDVCSAPVPVWDISISYVIEFQNTR
jgi:hypothetical protein